MPEGKSFARIKGDGRLVQGPCLVTDILWNCDKNDETCVIYDGLDATSGRRFCTLIGDGNTFYHYGLGAGVQFNNGVYVDQSTTVDEVTICFRHLE